MKTKVFIKDHLSSNRVIVSSIDEVTDTAVSQTIGHYSMGPKKLSGYMELC